MKPNALLLASLATTTTAIGMKPSPTPDKPATFRWKYPFSDEAMASWSPACTATKAFDAREYTLHDLTAPFPKGLGDWEEGLREFFGGREYPGGWGGWDKHLHDRSIVTMEWVDVPARVKAWIGEQEESEGEGKGLFAVFEKKKGEEGAEGAEGEAAAESAVEKTGDEDKIVIFAPGALYEVLPLWVADGSDCEGKSRSLSIPLSVCYCSLCLSSSSSFSHVFFSILHGFNENKKRTKLT